MNPEDDYNNHDGNSRDADNFHIAPEYGEQGEGPGEQPVKRAEHIPTTDGFKKPVSINITEVKTEEKETTQPTNPASSPFNHGEDDVMQYFTTEKKEDLSASNDNRGDLSPDIPISGIKTNGNISSISSSGGSGGYDRSPLGTRERSEGLAAEPHNTGREGRKKTNLMSTIAIVLITVLITAVAVFAILIITQGSSKDNKISTTGTTTKVETDSITCTKLDASDDEKKSVGDATSINTTIIANYTSGEMDDYSVMKRYTYDSASAAEAGLKKVKDIYTNKYVDMLEMNVDPFSSTYAQKDKEVTESHFASASDITSENINLINIPKPSSGTTPDISVVESTLKMSGYTCKVKSAE